MYRDSFRFVARDLGVRHDGASPDSLRTCISAAPLRVSVSSVDVGFRFILSATWLLAATRAQPLERFPWLGQHPPLVSILIFWLLSRVVDEAESIDGQGEFRAIAVEIVPGHPQFFHYGRQHLMNHPHALQQFVHVDVGVNLQGAIPHSRALSLTAQFSRRLRHQIHHLDGERNLGFVSHFFQLGEPPHIIFRDFPLEQFKLLFPD